MLVLVLEFSKISAPTLYRVATRPLSRWERRGMSGPEGHHSKEQSLLQNGRRESACVTVT